MNCKQFNRGLKYFALFMVVLLTGCSEDNLVQSPVSSIPELNEVNVNDNPNNVVSAVVSVTSKNASSLRVEFGEDSIHTHSTPSFPVTSNSTVVPVLGLKANRTYFIRVAAVSSSGYTITSQWYNFTTQPLPDNITRYSIVVNNSPADGFTMLGFTGGGMNTSYAVIMNNIGEIIWYRKFNGPVTDFQKQPGGTYTVFSILDDRRSIFYELDGLGNILHEYQSTSTVETGPHELLIRGTGYTLFGVEYRTMDLTQFGGLPNATVRGLIVEHGGSGSFLWNTFDHLSITEAMPDIPLNTQSVNPWHGNAIEIDRDGNYLVSFRNSDMIVKVSSQTGNIIWRLGGRNNQFTFINDVFNGFSHQHAIRRLDNGNIILFDNGNLHSPQVSRAAEYVLDENNKTARLVWQYIPSPALYASALGYAQRLPNGNTLICFGTAQRIIEVDIAGSKRWELSIDEPQRYSYRAFKINTLY